MEPGRSRAPVEKLTCEGGQLSQRSYQWGDQETIVLVVVSSRIGTETLPENVLSWVV